MIYIDPGDRRADTMNIVAEGLAWRDPDTGEFTLVATACGYLDLVLTNLAEFYEAGVIEEKPHSYSQLQWTKTGHYLWKQWKDGPARRVVQVPEPAERPAAALPNYAAAMLLDAGWTVNGTWKTESLECVVVSITRDGDVDSGEPLVVKKVLVLDRRGRTLLDLSIAQARLLVPTLLAATL